MMSFIFWTSRTAQTTNESLRFKSALSVDKPRPDVVPVTTTSRLKRDLNPRPRTGGSSNGFGGDAVARTVLSPNDMVDLRSYDTLPLPSRVLLLDTENADGMKACAANARDERTKQHTTRTFIAEQRPRNKTLDKSTPKICAPILFQVSFPCEFATIRRHNQCEGCARACIRKVRRPEPATRNRWT